MMIENNTLRASDLMVRREGLPLFLLPQTPPRGVRNNPLKSPYKSRNESDFPAAASLADASRETRESNIVVVKPEPNRT